MQLEPKKILVIDDDHDVRKTISDNMRDCGYTVWEAEDGERGLIVIEQGNYPDLVVTDIIMPRKEGLETIMEIRAKYPNIKLLAISGGGRTRLDNFLAIAKKMGANASLAKPVDMRELEKTIKELINGG
jgi:CheY-like chemotaxis protein